MALKINIARLKKALQNEHLRNIVSTGVDRFLFEDDIKNVDRNVNYIVFLCDLGILVESDELDSVKPLNS